MTDYPSMERLAELQQMITNFAKVERVPHLGDTNRPENDVEHSFGLALTCWYLQPHIAPNLNLGEILKYALAHDIVELHAGDTFVFDTAGAASKDTRERDAINTIAKDWPDFSNLSTYAQGYLDKENKEATFVKAVDKLLPVIMIEIGEGKVFWNRHNITLEMERENKVTILVSEQVSPYYELLLEWLDTRNNIPKS